MSEGDDIPLQDRFVAADMARRTDSIIQMGRTLTSDAAGTLYVWSATASVPIIAIAQAVKHKNPEMSWDNAVDMALRGVEQMTKDFLKEKGDKYQ